MVVQQIESSHIKVKINDTELNNAIVAGCEIHRHEGQNDNI